MEVGSTAQQAGIRVGDSLAEVGVTPLGPALVAAAREATFVYGQEIQSLRSRIGEGKPLKVVLIRDGRPMTLDVQPRARPVREGQATPTPVPQNELYMRP